MTDSPSGTVDTTAPDDFPVSFANHADGQETWEHDDMHLPFALTPLAADFAVEVIGGGFNPYYESFGAPQRMHAAVWNGWAYFSFRANAPEGEEDAAEARWKEIRRSRIPITSAYWRDDVLPELRRLYEVIQAPAFEGLPNEAAATAWLDAWAAARRAWVLHFISIMGPYQVLEDLSDAYAAAMGPGRDAEALGLIGGTHHELEEVEEGIEALAGLADEADLADVLERIVSSGEITDELDLGQLRVAPGADRFADELGRFLDRHGHLGQSHDDLRLASWAEAPRTLLGQIVSRLRQPASRARERETELARRADELAKGPRAALAGKPDELDHFETTLRYAREIGYLTEGHNYWIDRMSQARLRALAMRAGRRLVRQGALARADDVFFLGRDDVAEALRAPVDLRSLVERRKADLARWEQMTPPPIVGKVPDSPAAGDRFDGPRMASTESDVLRGTGASAGIVRGPARLVLSQDDFGSIHAGDVIVCPSSNPSWVPAFTLAAGLVTNTGGVLSHAAVVAREFGLPAVVGAAEATTRIADGRLIEIDGTAGIVRLL
jgi:phosphohistidine swiveling domain-containing protein